MKESINLKWSGKMVFEADVEGFKIKVDSKPEHGGTNQGPRPKPLMMVALAGCTAMDVISILNKMHVEYKDFTVQVEGDLNDEHPKYFKSMHIIYNLKGKDLQLEKIKKAVELSQNTYCGVSATYKKAMKLTYEIKITE